MEFFCVRLCSVLQVYRHIHIVRYLVAKAACICRMPCVSRHLNYLNIPLGRRIESPIIYTRYIPMNWWGQRLAPLYGRIRPSYTVYCELRPECCVGPSRVTHLLWYVNYVQTHSSTGVGRYAYLCL